MILDYTEERRQEAYTRPVARNLFEGFRESSLNHNQDEEKRKTKPKEELDLQNILFSESEKTIDEEERKNSHRIGEGLMKNGPDEP